MRHFGHPRSMRRMDRNLSAGPAAGEARVLASDNYCQPAETARLAGGEARLRSLGVIEVRVRVEPVEVFAAAFARCWPMRPVRQPSLPACASAKSRSAASPASRSLDQVASTGSPAS